MISGISKILSSRHVHLSLSGHHSVALFENERLMLYLGDCIYNQAISSYISEGRVNVDLLCILSNLDLHCCFFNEKHEFPSSSQPELDLFLLKTHVHGHMSSREKFIGHPSFFCGICAGVYFSKRYWHCIQREKGHDRFGKTHSTSDRLRWGWWFKSSNTGFQLCSATLCSSANVFCLASSGLCKNCTFQTSGSNEVRKVNMNFLLASLGNSSGTPGVNESILSRALPQILITNAYCSLENVMFFSKAFTMYMSQYITRSR